MGEHVKNKKGIRFTLKIIGSVILFQVLITVITVLVKN